MVDEMSSEAVKKLDTQETTHTFDSRRMLLRLCWKTSLLVQISTWADIIKGLSLQLVGFMFLLTLESPTRVNSSWPDILMQSHRQCLVRNTKILDKNL